MTSVRSPLGYAKSDVDGVLAMKHIYPELINKMSVVAEADELEDLIISGKIGISWGSSDGESGGLLIDSYLAADGIENVIKVLEDLEDQKISGLKFIELNACPGGCVGGVLTVENPYVAKSKLKKLRRYMPVTVNHMDIDEEDMYFDNEIEYEPVYTFGSNVVDNINKMMYVEELCKKFPGLDCGSCGAPSCKALAEDIVRGQAKEKDCIHVLRQFINRFSDEINS